MCFSPALCQDLTWTAPWPVVAAQRGGAGRAGVAAVHRQTSHSERPPPEARGAEAEAKALICLKSAHLQADELACLVSVKIVNHKRTRLTCHPPDESRASLTTAPPRRICSCASPSAWTTTRLKAVCSLARPPYLALPPPLSPPLSRKRLDYHTVESDNPPRFPQLVSSELVPLYMFPSWCR